MALAWAMLCFLLASGCAPMPGKAVMEVGGQTIAYVKRGTRPPAIVLQSGLGDGQSTWAQLLSALDPEQLAFAYDRPGYGDSPATSAARDPCSIATELRNTLQSAGVAPPYLLVGHSIGGLYQYAYARLYPEEVAGILLLDPTHPRHWQQIQERLPGIAFTLRTLRATLFTRVMRREFDDQAACNAQLAGLASPGVPIRMLVRTEFATGETAEFQTLVRELEGDWQTLLPGLIRTEAQGSGHYIHNDRTGLVLEQLALMGRPSG
jgi:pimeloyl-ACP methyl ester carboxylesterase